MTFLELAQAVARDSGTLDEMPTVQDQVGRTRHAILWTAEAWRDIQRKSAFWRWMSRNFAGTTLPGVSRYDPAAMGVERFQYWARADGPGASPYTAHGDDRAQEWRLQRIDWRAFEQEFTVGSAVTKRGRPRYISVDPLDRLALHPTPDAEYVLRGPYQAGMQELVNDDDVPEMPGHFHELIKWGGLLHLATFDEAEAQFPIWQRRYNSIMAQLQRQQLPGVEMPGPLA